MWEIAFKKYEVKTFQRLSYTNFTSPTVEYFVSYHGGCFRFSVDFQDLSIFWT